MTVRATPAAPDAAVIELDITALAAGGDGVGRDANGRVTFVPRSAPGDRVRARIVHATSSFARAELTEIVTPGAARSVPACPHFEKGCGGCQWQHVTRAEQRAAKQAIVAGALRKLEGVRVHPIHDPGPALGWRRRARFHVERGRAGLYVLGSQRVLPIEHCPQLEPALDAAYAVVAAATPPDGELALLCAHDGRIAVATERAWRGAARLVGRAGIAGVLAGGEPHGEVVLEVEPGLWGSPWDFAQANRAGNAALIAQVREALGPGPGRLLELYAGAGNFTRGFFADGWEVVSTDAVAPAQPLPGFHAGPVKDVLAHISHSERSWDAIVLDPPRTGAAEAIEGILRAAPRMIVYVSCDVATLARDAARLTGYRASDAWPFDVMPETAHIEVVMRLQRG
ncbi:MAG TPA: TRAM domain-containing protein [Kofleriaceae bacterium]|jgi:23S rRNA (uracil1939-C5)-methyltransferase|nr:TRAM domain-containing protein [Kofleriaceae bacterium]